MNSNEHTFMILAMPTSMEQNTKQNVNVISSLSLDIFNTHY